MVTAHQTPISSRSAVREQSGRAAFDNCGQDRRERFGEELNQVVGRSMDPSTLVGSQRLAESRSRGQDPHKAGDSSGSDK